MRAGQLAYIEHARFDHTCGSRECEEPIGRELFHIGIIYSRKSGKRFTIYLHEECLIPFIRFDFARRKGIIEENRAKGITNKGGRPRNEIAPEQRALRSRLTKYVYKDCIDLFYALATNNAVRTKSCAYKLSLRLEELASEDMGTPYKTHLNERLVSTMRAKDEYGFQNRYMEWVEGTQVIIRNPRVVAIRLREDFCPDKLDSTLQGIKPLAVDKWLVMQDRWVELGDEYPNWTDSEIKDQLQKEGYDV